MSWALFIDESGQDQQRSPYEVLAGVAVEDRKLWKLICDLSRAQVEIFGLNLFEIYGKEAKAQKLLKTKVFKHAAQLPAMDPIVRAKLAREIIEDGETVSRDRLTALAQAKLAYVETALDLCAQANVSAFASIVPQSAIRPPNNTLRKDYAYLFERFFNFLNNQKTPHMGYLIFDEIEKSASQILLNQVGNYFLKTNKGQKRSRLIIPEPLFVHSDLTTMIQIADIVAYVVSWSVRLKGMEEPRRSELDFLATKVIRLRSVQQGVDGFPQFGFKLITDLRGRAERTTNQA